MPEIIKDADGNEREIYTAEEVIEMNKRYEELQEKVEKLEVKDYNYSQLKQKVKSIESKVLTKEEELNKKEEELADKEKQSRIDMQERYIIEASGGDDELKKRIMYHFGRLNDTATNAEEIRKKVDSAKVLAGLNTPNDDTNPLMTVGGVGNFPSATSRRQKEKFSPDLIDLASKFNKTPDDLRKHGVI